MTVKEIEKVLIEYIELNFDYHHKENALKELGKLTKDKDVNCCSNIRFIVNDYPNYDHFLLKLNDDNFFLKFGLSREYLKSLNKKDIHRLAKGLHSFFGQFRLVGGLTNE